MTRKQSLNQGVLTEMTQEVLNIEKEIRGEGLELLLNISNYIRSNLKYREVIPHTNSEKDFYNESQKRTTSEIIKSGYLWSCSDAGQVFATIARARNIPTSYIQTVDVIVVKNDPKDIQGHVYCSCIVDEEEYLIDPDKGVLIKVFDKGDRKKLYRFRNIQKQIEVFEDIDSDNAGITSQKELEKVMIQISDNYWKTHSIPL